MPGDERGNIAVRVGAESEGEEVYERHEQGISRISSSARASIVAFRESRKEMFQYRIGLLAVNSALASVNMLVGVAGIKNEGLRKGLIALNAVVAVGNTLLLIRAVLEAKAAAAMWKRAIATIAAAGPAAPLIAALVATGVLAALALMHQANSATRMAQGGAGVVTKPTLFLAGEAGPESYSFTPLRGGYGVSSGGSVNVGSIHMMVYTNDPDVLSKAWVEKTRRLKEVLR